MTSTSHLYQIDWCSGRSRPCFGVVVVGDTVREAAPIARWAVGKPWRTVRAWYEKRGAVVQEAATP